MFALMKGLSECERLIAMTGEPRRETESVAAFASDPLRCARRFSSICACAPATNESLVSA